MNLNELKAEFNKLTTGKTGIISAAPYKKVYESLMPIQQKNLVKIGKGVSVVVFGIYHSSEALESINIRKNGKTDYEAWNIYAKEYHELNRLLYEIGVTLAEYCNGVSIPPTIEGVATMINRVEDFYGMTVSQRVGAELAGLGWRGKNELIVTKKGCGIRLGSVICPDKLEYGQKMENLCNGCTACLEVCPFLRKKDILKNYQEQCRRFIVTLGLQGDVCGKCVKACYHHWLQ